MRASEDVKARLGDYAALAQSTRQAIDGAVLVTFPNLGHSPHIEAPDAFMPKLLDGLDTILKK